MFALSSVITVRIGLQLSKIFTAALVATLLFIGLNLKISDGGLSLFLTLWLSIIVLICKYAIKSMDYWLGM